MKPMSEFNEASRIDKALKCFILKKFRNSYDIYLRTEQGKYQIGSEGDKWRTLINKKQKVDINFRYNSAAKELKLIVLSDLDQYVLRSRKNWSIKVRISGKEQLISVKSLTDTFGDSLWGQNFDVILRSSGHNRILDSAAKHSFNKSELVKESGKYSSIASIKKNPLEGSRSNSYQKHQLQQSLPVSNASSASASICPSVQAKKTVQLTSYEKRHLHQDFPASKTSSASAASGLTVNIENSVQLKSNEKRQLQQLLPVSEASFTSASTCSPVKVENPETLKSYEKRELQQGLPVSNASSTSAVKVDNLKNYGKHQLQQCLPFFEASPASATSCSSIKVDKPVQLKSNSAINQSGTVLFCL